LKRVWVFEAGWEDSNVQADDVKFIVAYTLPHLTIVTTNSLTTLVKIQKLHDSFGMYRNQERETNLSNSQVL